MYMPTSLANRGRSNHVKKFPDSVVAPTSVNQHDWVTSSTRCASSSVRHLAERGGPCRLPEAELDKALFKRLDASWFLAYATSGLLQFGVAVPGCAVPGAQNPLGAAAAGP